VPLHFLALKAQLVVLVSAFVMVSTVSSVSCLLFYSRWPCPAICKSGGHVPPPMPHGVGATVGQCIPGPSGGSRKGSSTNSWQFERRCNKMVGSDMSECVSTWYDKSALKYCEMHSLSETDFNGSVNSNNKTSVNEQILTLLIVVDLSPKAGEQGPFFSGGSRSKI